MNRIILTTLLFVFLGIGKSNAQMAAAQSVGWNIDHTIQVPVHRDSVWTLLKDYNSVSKLSNGYVQSIVHKDDIMPILRETTFKEGTKREELLSQLDEPNRFLVFKIKDTSLPEGVQSAQIAVFTKIVDDNTCEITWKGIVKGKKEAETKYIEVLKAEIAQYEIGFKNYLQGQPKVIKAMRMQ
ncbi:MAG: hypothetical protein LBE37_14250 [Sphingobacterium sp.]|jgi:hypothetical protein|nr:hypothetical protein [Sphingobacterium sp.]